MIVVEQLRAEYLEQIRDLHYELLPFGLRSKEEAEQKLQMMLDSEDHFMAVAREGDEILGTATGVCCHILSCSMMVIDDVVVKKDCRGKGVGTMLMKALDEFAIKRDCMYSLLVSSDFRIPAHKFYEKLGFDGTVRGFRKNYK